MVSHPVILKGLGVHSADELPTILERTDQDFIAAILDKLKAENGVGGLLDTKVSRRNGEGVLRLLQPIQRTFNIAVFEAVCDSFSPFAQVRLDPSRIDSAGMVLRRRAIDSHGNIIPDKLEGWRQADKAFRGWVAFNNSVESNADPDYDLRPVTSAGQAELDRRLSRLRISSESLSESVAPLFVAPPEVCEATGKTILYGLVPVTSSELSEVPADFAPFDPADLANDDHLPTYFRANRPASVRQIPRNGAIVNSNDADDSDIEDFVAFLRQVAVEFDAFGEGDASRELFDELNNIDLPIAADVTRPAGDFLKQATTVLVERPSVEENPSASARRVRMPQIWPALSTSQAQRLLDRIRASIAANLASTIPNEGRFDDPDRQYQLGGFVRVIQEEDCPPKIVWSKISEPFTIAPWYESGDAPPALIQLPDAFDKNLLKSLKPNVAFAMSPKMFNTLNALKPEEILQGSGSAGNGIGLGWICSFSIPIITICAFIVLNIFLQLFNIIFQWLLYIKICIPFPKPK